MTMPHGATRREVLEAIRDREGDTGDSIGEYLGLTRQAIHYHFARLHGEGLVWRTGRGWKCDPYRYRLSLTGQQLVAP